MKCKNCGAVLDEGALFCRKCGTAAPKPEPKKKTGPKINLSGVKKWFRKAKERVAALLKNRRFMMFAGASLALLLVLIIVIVSVASCGRKKATGFKSPEEVANAAVIALEGGDGERLYKMTSLSESLLGKHPEVFGEGDTPEAVMKGYYTGLAADLGEQLSEQYDREITLMLEAEPRLLSGIDIFESNRALGVEAAQYAEIEGPLSVDGETVRYVRMVAAEINGEWKLIVLYLSDTPIY